MTTTELPAVTRDHSYWIGWLAATVRDTIRNIETITEDGQHLMDREDIARIGRDFLADYYASEIGQYLTPNHGDRLYDGFVVESATGEAQAARDTYEEAVAALTAVESYWWEAENCGHPAAPGFVAELRPFRIRQVTRAERDMLREDPPTIDREP